MTNRDDTEEDDERVAESDSHRVSGPPAGGCVPADWLIDSGVGPQQDREVGESK